MSTALVVMASVALVVVGAGLLITVALLGCLILDLVELAIGEHR